MVCNLSLNLKKRSSHSGPPRTRYLSRVQQPRVQHIRRPRIEIQLTSSSQSSVSPSSQSGWISYCLSLGSRQPRCFQRIFMTGADSRQISSTKDRSYTLFQDRLLDRDYLVSNLSKHGGFFLVHSASVFELAHLSHTG